MMSFCLPPPISRGRAQRKQLQLCLAIVIVILSMLQVVSAGLLRLHLQAAMLVGSGTARSLLILHSWQLAVLQIGTSYGEACQS